MKQYKNYIVIGICCLLVGRYILQPKQEVEIREVVKYVEKKEENTKTKKKIVKKETTKPDGSTTSETTIIEDNSSSSSSSVAQSKERYKKEKTGRAISFGVLAIKDVAEFRKAPDIGIVLSMPLLGNLSVVTTADSSKRVGLGLSVEF